MQTIDRAAADFLACRRIAVVGVSRTPKGHGGNVVYTRLRDRGYEVFAVNPHADAVEGDRCYRSLAEIPGGVDAVVIATPPEAAVSVMGECDELGITRTWLHRSFGRGSVSDAATELGRARGITVIDGWCPLMFAPADDRGHRLMKLLLSRSTKLPAQV